MKHKTKDRTLRQLLRAEFRVTALCRTRDDLGWRIELAGGQVVVVYDFGTRVVQGRDPTAVRNLLMSGTSKKRFDQNRAGS